MQPASDAEDLTKNIIGLAMKVHRTLGPGFVEFVYRNAVLVELRRANLQAEIEKSLKVAYEGVVVGEFNADLLVE